MKLKLILVRHGQTRLNQERRIQGCFSDPELNEHGEWQAERLGWALREEKLSTIYSSPLRRALQTAQAIAHHHRLLVRVETAFQEINTGLLDGLSLEEVKSQHTAFFQEWRSGLGDLRLPGGESMAELQERAWGALQNIFQSHPEGEVVVVGHGFTLATLICRALNLPLPSFRRLRLDAGGISVLTWEGERATLAKFNDTCHLREQGK